MILLYRARIFLVAAVLAAIVLLVLELPLSTILRQRGQIATASHELGLVQRRNTELRADVAALRENSAIAAIAHEEYGLVQPGQQSFVILPSAGASNASGLLGTRSLPASDLVVQASDPSTPAAKSAPAHSSLTSRVLDRLEFWRWAF